jgi:hypothetical protein
VGKEAAADGDDGGDGGKNPEWRSDNERDNQWYSDFGRHGKTSGDDMGNGADSTLDALNGKAGPASHALTRLRYVDGEDASLDRLKR